MSRRLAAWVAAIVMTVGAAQALRAADPAHPDVEAQPADRQVSEAGTHSAGGAHAGDTHGVATHDDAHGGHEKPALIPDPGNRQTVMSAIWVVIIFVLLLAILYPTAWKNVLAGLKAREERIRRDIADAEAARSRAEATLKEYNAQLAAAEARVREMLNKATVDGEKIAQNIRMQAQVEGEQLKERAQRDIEAARDQAIAQLHEESVVLATNIAEKIIRRNLNPQDQRDLLARSLDELQTVGSR